jgi:putative membrane protein
MKIRSCHLVLIAAGAIGGLLEAVPAQAQAQAAKSEAFTDADVLGVLDAANSGEVEQGKVAVAKGQTEAVRSFGQMMITEHGAAQKKGEAIAKQLGIHLASNSTALSLKARSEQLITQLHHTNTSAFDGVYMGSQITLHEDVIKLIDGQLRPQAQSPAVKTFVGEVRTHVQHHLDVAKRTMKTLVPKSS